MGKLIVDNEAIPAAPASGKTTIFPDSTSLEPAFRNSTVTKTLRVLTNSGFTTTAGVDIYIVGSNITVPPQLAQVGAQFLWRLMMHKTAACTSAPIYNIRVGTAGSLSDTVRVTWTSTLLQTAAIDDGLLEIFCTVTTAGASGIINGSYALNHRGNTAGFATTPGDGTGPTASGAFDLTVANLIFGLSINPGNIGANAVWTIQCYSQAFNL